MSYNIASFIVCDDVRREASGKEILIGVYGEAIILPKFPIRLAKLSFRLAVTDISVAGPSMFTFSVNDSDGASRVHFEQPLPSELIQSYSVLTFVAANLKFEKATELRAEFGIDCVPRFIGRVAIRQAETDEERERIAS